VYHDLPGDTFRTLFFDPANVTQMSIVSHPLKTPGLAILTNNLIIALIMTSIVIIVTAYESITKYYYVVL
jgi:hypothetical protein